MKPSRHTMPELSQLIALFCDSWGDGRWQDCSDSNPPHEAKTLRLSIEKAKLSSETEAKILREELKDLKELIEKERKHRGEAYGSISENVKLLGDA